MQHDGFTKAQDALDFIFGGNATFTMTSAASGQHFTYKVRQKDETTPFFVSVRYKTDGDWTDYRYIGFLHGSDRANLIAGRKGCPDSDSFKALRWALQHLCTRKIPDQLTIQHEGACCVCNRPLTDPESIRLGIGPVCRGEQ